MDTVENNRKIAETYYTSINGGDFDSVLGLMSEDVIFHVIGTGPFSGRWEGRDRVYGILVPSVMKSFKPETVVFAGKWKIMCADEGSVVGLMTGEAETTKDKKFEATYCQIFKITDSIITEVYEFLDTDLNAKTHDPKNLLEPADDYGMMRF
tara:strand:+ start:4562 stop:5017 length:456 start_codon:yes stop_codon:yes gene_type:complete